MRLHINAFFIGENAPDPYFFFYNFQKTSVNARCTDFYLFFITKIKLYFKFHY